MGFYSPLPEDDPQNQRRAIRVQLDTVVTTCADIENTLDDMRTVLVDIGGFGDAAEELRNAGAAIAYASRLIREACDG